MAPLWIALAVCSIICSRAAADVGVCYGLHGDNLPPPKEVVALYKHYGIQSMRLFDPNPSALEALKGSGIGVILGVPNTDIPNIASSQAAAQQWFDTNLAPYLNDVNFFKNVGGIKVGTAVPLSVLGTLLPPSAGQFSKEVDGVMRAILGVLSAQGSPLMINVYPYYGYVGDPANVLLDYAVFRANGTVVKDGPLGYSNLFDAMVDAFYSAMEKAGGSTVGVVVTESSWPSAGKGNVTTLEIAGTYNRNFLAHLNASGTPKRPHAKIDGYIFAMFSENLKPGTATEQNFGLFYPNYHVFNPII
ncbi:glucan endo-1,3-beta-glucosidase-like [Vitis vinifera]|uniref:glucan endo-1,3-beta-glucosidase-like n=1 Tax=Vitis vinifera TaxID=29760 RepID=UPI002882DDDB|nr:glucan endo-1,3-beta-glucosidase-like [Vitis vinifera]